MTPTRDELIRAALVEEVELPVGLDQRISASIRRTPQRGRGSVGWSGPRLLALGLALLLMAAALVIGGVVTLRITVPDAPPSVPMARGGPERTGRMVGPGPSGRPMVVWHQQLGGAVPPSAPVAAHGKVIVPDDAGNVTAFDIASGARAWTIPLSSRIRSVPAIVGELVVVGTDGGEVVALRIDDGTQAWTVPGLGSIVGPLAVVEDTVLAPSTDGNLYAISAGGVVERMFELGAPLENGTAISGDVMYQPTTEGELVALDRMGGTERWRADLGPGAVMTPIATNEVVYVTAGVGPEARTRELVALSAADGTVLWLQGFDIQVYPGAVANDLVIVATDSRVLTAFDRDGSVAWRDSTSDIVPACCAVVDGTLYASTGSGTVLALDAASGEQRWSVPVGGTTNNLIVIDGRVIVGGSTGVVSAIGDGTNDAVASPR